VGTATADSDGAFEARLDVPDLPVGRHAVLARCGGVEIEIPVDLVISSSTPSAGAATTAVILCFFVLIGLVIVQPLRGNTGSQDRNRRAELRR
jgi:hypothetical protein